MSGQESSYSGFITTHSIIATQVS